MPIVVGEHAFRHRGEDPSVIPAKAGIHFCF
jgi:hypothetical protein